MNDPKYSYILAAIATLILAVACINFVTLSVGRSIKRAKEVGIRKVVGAERMQLIFQFIGEALIVTMISLAVGVVVSVLSLPLFNDLSGKALVFEPNAFCRSHGSVPRDHYRASGRQLSGVRTFQFQTDRNTEGKTRHWK